jgi:hypothetical protein
MSEVERIEEEPCRINNREDKEWFTIKEEEDDREKSVEK